LLFVLGAGRARPAAPEAALVGQVGGDDEHREEQEREQRLPESDDILTELRQYQHQPQVGEYTRRRRHEKYL